MPDASQFTAWSASWGRFKHPVVCPACGYRSVVRDGWCGPCGAIRREHGPVLGLPPAAGRLHPTPRRSPTVPATIDEAAMEVLVAALAAHILANPTCPRCGRPAATLAAEPCPGCVAELAAERVERHEREKLRQRTWWNEFGEAWRAERKAAEKAARKGMS